MELSMKGRGPGPPWGTTQESVTSDLKQSILMIYTFSKPKQDGHGHRWPCAPLCVPSGLRLRAFQGDGSRRRDPEPPTRQPERSAVALGSAGRTCVPRARPGYVRRGPARSREQPAHREGGGAPRAVPPAPAGGGAAPHGSSAAPAGPARQVAAPPRGRRAERNAPAAPARGRAAVGVASRPHLAPTGCGAVGRDLPGGPLAARPSYLHTGRRGARAGRPARGGRGSRGPAAAAEFGQRAGDGPASGLQVPGCAELPGRSSERCQAEGSLGQATGVVVRPLALRTGAPTTGLLRAISGNFLKEDGAKFGFSVHFCLLNKAAKRVGMRRTCLW
ncbi:translation initiation factor IF-2-like [Felis catus]|uniref:translation initiation factor IF-2-like n=1 Tax=Felis catus TaxID=9685 RepID=UPI001D1A2C97|nr:translation initiation factor IF-2-like [Felis catus]